MVVDGEMDPEIPTPPASSTITTSDISFSPAGFYVLDITLISAKDLAPVSKSMRPYAITWIDPSRKITSRVDQKNNNNPLWNDKFTFRIDQEFLSSDEGAVTFEIYTGGSWFKDVLVGTVKVLISDLITSSTRNSTRFLALQIRRPSGNPQGILNISVTLMDTLANHMGKKASLEEKVGDVEYEEIPNQINEKVQLWRSHSVGTNDFYEEFPMKQGSVINGSGSVCNGSELCSDIGPSASIVAGEIARKLLPPMGAKLQPNERADNGEDTGSSIVEEMTLEEAIAKGLISNVGNSRKDVSATPKNQVKFGRSKSDGGLFSCFGNALGCEITIVCGANKPTDAPNISKSSRSSSKKRFIGSQTSSS